MSAFTNTSEPSAHLRLSGSPSGEPARAKRSLLRSAVSKACWALLISHLGPVGGLAARLVRRVVETRSARASAVYSPDIIGPQLPGSASLTASQPPLEDASLRVSCVAPARYSVAGQSVSVLVSKARPVWLVRSVPAGDRRLLQALACFATMPAHAQWIDLLAALELAIQTVRQAPAASRRVIIVSVHPIPASPRLDALLAIVQQDRIALAFISLEPPASGFVSDPLAPLTATGGVSTTAGSLSAMLEQQLPHPRPIGELVVVLESSVAMREVAHGQSRARYVADAFRARWAPPAA